MRVCLVQPVLHVPSCVSDNVSLILFNVPSTHYKITTIVCYMLLSLVCNTSVPPPNHNVYLYICCLVYVHLHALTITIIIYYYYCLADY